MRKKTNMRIDSGTHHMLKVYAARKGLDLSAAIQDLVSAAEISDAIKGDWKPPKDAEFHSVLNRKLEPIDPEGKLPKRERLRGKKPVKVLVDDIPVPRRKIPDLPVNLSKGVYGGKRK